MLVRLHLKLCVTFQLKCTCFVNPINFQRCSYQVISVLCGEKRLTLILEIIYLLHQNWLLKISLNYLLSTMDISFYFLIALLSENFMIKTK